MQKPVRQQKTVQIQFKDETKVHPALKEYFGYCLFKVSAKFRHLMNEALSEHDLQSHHLGILKVLEKSGPISQIQLGDELGIDKASMVKLIDQLEKQKLVQRNTDPHDRRIKNIRMTALGDKKIKMCHSVKMKTEKVFFRNLSPEQKNDIQEILRVLIDQ